ncbi:hypothetical protein EZV62_026678 [Acer yangbiense]|uniref:Uncharacterized protein n=1 Tax=Acer yangbiense TaxID=1000413 RepID=A0A5C7GRE9_9ROSI|nr:hypothetical protein EZV62_026678 [Acer yangbiense]
MSTSKSISRKRGSNSSLNKLESKKRVVDDFDAGFSSDFKDIMSALRQIKEKAHKDGQKKIEEMISSVASEIRSKIDQLNSKLVKDRQDFAKAYSENLTECGNFLEHETAKIQEVYKKFYKEKGVNFESMLNLGVFEKFSVDKDKEKGDSFEGMRDASHNIKENKKRMLMRNELLGKQQDSLPFFLLNIIIPHILVWGLKSETTEKNLISEQEKFCAEQIAKLVVSLEKEKQDDKTFSTLKIILCSFLVNASDEDFLPDD